MNNELAEIIEHLENAKYIGASKAAEMLRMLDGQLAFRIDAVTKYQAKVEEQQAEIEALKEQCVLLQEGYNAQAILLGVETGLTPDFFFMENDLMGKR
jgi:Asp-tRNA(Asn)/Glu-tRNA(Gln) amidotransferase C subunit